MSKVENLNVILIIREKPEFECVHANENVVNLAIVTLDSFIIEIVFVGEYKEVKFKMKILLSAFFSDIKDINQVNRAIIAPRVQN